jgi:hypothetical protein
VGGISSSWSESESNAPRDPANSSRVCRLRVLSRRGVVGRSVIFAVEDSEAFEGLEREVFDGEREREGATVEDVVFDYLVEVW